MSNSLHIPQAGQPPSELLPFKTAAAKVMQPSYITETFKPPATTLSKMADLPIEARKQIARESAWGEVIRRALELGIQVSPSSSLPPSTPQQKSH
jgi:hypothetical protein